MPRLIQTIAEFKHRVAVCSMDDVVEQGGNMVLRRKDVYHCWAKIKPSQGSLYTGDGDAVKQNRETRTHKITIRFRRDIDFTQAAWFYEERLQSGGRWFKLLAMNEQLDAGMYLDCDVRLVSRGLITPPVPPVATCQSDLPLGVLPTPQGVEL